MYWLAGLADLVDLIMREPDRGELIACEKIDE
jgi:hypothetical protein